MLKDIVIKGARENNLKNVSLTIPKNKLVVLTGVSGSGKSTLAFDTIFAEGQRRYMESLSSYARQFLGQAKKPDVDSIDGLSPSISIDQKTTSNNPRSTVGTVTEIYDYMRLLFAHIGEAYCPNCKKPIKSQSIDVIVDKIMGYGDGEKVMILSPIALGKKGMFAKELDALRKEGYARVLIDNEVKLLSENIELNKNNKHDIFVVVDRLVIREDVVKRLTDSLEVALNKGDGVVYVEASGKKQIFSTKHACPECGYSISEIMPRDFSFNSPFGACDYCAGLGFIEQMDVNKIIVDPSKPIFGGGMVASGWGYDGSISKMYMNAIAKHFNEDINKPIKDLPSAMLDMILYGTRGDKIEITYGKNYERTSMTAFEGIINNLERRYRETTSDYAKNELAKYLIQSECPKCGGRRLKSSSLNVFINKLNIMDLCDKSVVDIKQFLSELKLSKTKQTVSAPILKEINNRLDFLINVGLGYLTLSRRAGTLSGGEAQRIRLASQIGNGLTGVLYILDEPSIGLHQRDNDKLIDTMCALRDMGNTVIVVEHDEDTIRSADYIVDVGKFAGVHGGNIVGCGSVQDIINSPESITGKYLSGEWKIDVPSGRRQSNGKALTVVGAKENNLKNITVEIPLGVITMITGVSGSGKSSLINDILYPAVYNFINKSNLPEGKYSEIKGLENIDKVINIDQSPIGKTPRSNPATYTNVFTDIRELFASTVDAKERGYKSSRFSFNVSGGRCENCGGAGINKIEMYFLPDIFVPCEVCGGKRYNRETLEVKYKGKNINDVLNMTISEANKFFDNLPKIKNKLQTLEDVGLGYIKLGQPATELSGGEAQRVKLATELSKRSTGKSLYILDEPTTGLHMYDVDKLIKIINRLVENGNSIVIIEHNLDMIKCADYIIDLGPEGGDAGGTIIATGTPEEIVKNGVGYTAKYLKKYLKK